MYSAAEKPTVPFILRSHHCGTLGTWEGSAGHASYQGALDLWDMFVWGAVCWSTQAFSLLESLQDFMSVVFGEGGSALVTVTTGDKCVPLPLPLVAC